MINLGELRALAPGRMANRRFDSDRLAFHLLKVKSVHCPGLSRNGELSELINSTLRLNIKSMSRFESWILL